MSYLHLPPYPIGLQYPNPPGGVVDKSEAWLMGWMDVYDDKPPRGYRFAAEMIDYKDGRKAAESNKQGEKLMADIEPGTSSRSWDIVPEGWYERNHKLYPVPVNEDGWTNNNTEFLEGWEAAVVGDNVRPTVSLNIGTDLAIGRYFEGYQKGLLWATAHGIVDSFRATEMFKQIPPAKPAVQSTYRPKPTTERADVIKLDTMKSVLIPSSKSLDWQDGFRDAANMKPMVLGKPNDYNEGYHSGLEWLVAEGTVSASRARELMGLPDIGDIEDTEPKVDMVTRPPHYTFGKYEVIDVLYDWQLEYPLDNVVKYAARAGKKGDEAQQLQDLEKIRYYTNFLIVQKGGEDWNPNKENN